MIAMNDTISTGGSPIISYSLEWDEGLSNVWIPVFGYDANNIMLTHQFRNLS